MCECYQVGGRFIAEDPDCAEHGIEARRRESHRDVVIAQLDEAISIGGPHDVYRAALNALDYLQSL